MSEKEIGETWVQPYTGAVYRWDGEKWVHTGEYIPVQDYP